MLGLLEEIKERTSEAHEYLGDAALRSALSRLEASNDPKQRFGLTFQAGMELLRLGRTDEAIERLEAAVQLFSALEDSLPAGQREQVKQAMLFQTAVAHLRRGETENCVCCQTGDSCLLPIQGSGVHQNTRGSRKAIEYLTRVLELAPQDPQAVWLFNLAHMTLGTYPDQVPEQFRIVPEKFRSDIEFPRFYDIAPQLGLNTFNLCGGTIVDDIDNDGFLDLITSTWDTAGQIRYFHNNGDGTFSELTEQAGLQGLLGGLNLVQADYDNDSDVDVLVLRGAWLNEQGHHPNSLLRNDGQGGFRDVTFEAGLGEVHAPTQTAAWADYDLDGDLDLFVGNEGVPCQLFENQGNGAFRDVASAAGVTNDGYTKGAVWGDYDDDRYPDLYVSNLSGPNRLYRNRGDGSFEDVARRLNVTQPKQGFPVWFWDFNNDGALDIFASSYEVGVEYVAAEYLDIPVQTRPDCLYQGDGRGGFTEVAVKMGLNRVTQPMGSNFGDLNNDGFPDFYLGTGYPNYEGLMPNLMFVNRGGSHFADVTTAGGFGHLQKGHGVAFADMDNDGDQDVFIQIGGAFPGDAFSNVLFRNPGFENNWITLHLVGVQSNRRGVGCRIRAEIVEDGARRSIYKWVNSGGSFGANPLRQEIGLGKAQQIETLEVFWPRTGRTQAFHNVEARQCLEIVEGRATYRKLPWKTVEFSGG